MVGLLIAIERFDRSRPTRLITYATYWIEGRIKRLIGSACPRGTLSRYGRVERSRLRRRRRGVRPRPGRRRGSPASLDDDGAAGSVRSHKKGKEPRGEATGATDGRSAALAAVVAHAVEHGSLGEQLYYADLAARQIHPHRGPGFSEIGEFRASHLPDGLISPEEVGVWIECHLVDEGPAAAGYLCAALGEAELGELGELPMSQSREAYARWLEGQAQRVRDRPDR